MRDKDLLRKADLALSDLINDGGWMPPEPSTRFVRKVMDAPTILNMVRTVPMRRSTMEISKIGFGTRMLQAGKNSSTQNGGPYAIGQRAPTRYKPVTSKISMNTSEIIAEIDLPYEVIEDSIEGGQIDNSQFENTILDMMAARAAIDLEELLVLGDITSLDSYLALQDGIIKRASTNIVDQSASAVDPLLFGNMIKALPTKYHRLLGQYRLIVPTVREIDYRMTVANRQTALGDALLTGTSPVAVLGIPLVGSPRMPLDTMLLTVPSNIILGIWRNFRIEYDRDVRERVIIIVLTMRAGVQIEEEDMLTKAINVGGD